MELEDFKRMISRKALMDKILLYGFSALIMSAVIYGLYNITNDNKFKYEHLRFTVICYLFSLVLIFFCLKSHSAIKNRYKILSLESSLPIDTKEKIVLKLLSEYPDPEFKITNCCFTIKYWAKGLPRNLWTPVTYHIFINLDAHNFYISVQGHVPTKQQIYDFGDTERLRNKILKSLGVLSEPRGASAHDGRSFES